MGTSPGRRASMRSTSMSAHTTLWPRWAKQAAVVRPTYPAPTTAMSDMAPPALWFPGRPSPARGAGGGRGRGAAATAAATAQGLRRRLELGGHPGVVGTGPHAPTGTSRIGHLLQIGTGLQLCSNELRDGLVTSGVAHQGPPEVEPLGVAGAGR